MKINKNVLWCNFLTDELIKLGLKNVCISPGSRSTPITYAVAKRKELKKFVIIDERSSAYFALGIAKRTKEPTVIICTSGTAAAEFYPAIIEAYKSHVPLLILTADRPKGYFKLGANQTINQDNLYKNHIHCFYDMGLPEVSLGRFESLKIFVTEAYFNCKTFQAPVHINLPFAKPLEPKTFTDDVDESFLKQINKLKFSSPEISLKTDSKLLIELKKNLEKVKSGLIICGPANFDENDKKYILQLSEDFNFPIIAEASSNLRINHKNIISEYDAILRLKEIYSNITPEVILHFGGTLTSNVLENFISASSNYYLINQYGAWHNPKNNAKGLIKLNAYEFCYDVLKSIKNNFDDNYLKCLRKLNDKAISIKNNILDEEDFLTESEAIKNIINVIPDNSNLIISNSMPIRDAEYFVTSLKKNIKVYNNRGTSGIDGVISTASGLAADGKRTFLIIGDLSFFYDINSLINIRNYKLPITIFIINNNMGGIFNSLPIREQKDVLSKYFLTPLNLNFSPIVKAFDIPYHQISEKIYFSEIISDIIKKNKQIVIDVKVDNDISHKLRLKYWKRVKTSLLSEL